jgi:uncharacterized protein
LSSNTEPSNSGDTTSRSVIEFLRQNPDFFVHHDELLSVLRIPHASGQAVSLVERQVHVLRDQLDSCSAKLKELVAIARENEILADRMHTLTLALMDTGSFDETITVLQDELFDHFQADAVELRLFSSGELDNPNDFASEERRFAVVKLKEFLDNEKPVCGILDRHQLDYIFGPLAESIRSTAIVPIQSNDTCGILAIGSRSAERFSPDKGTLFLRRLGDLVNRVLEKVSLPGI